MKTFFFTLISFFLISANILFAQTQQEANDAYGDGKVLIGVQQYDLAIKSFEKAIEIENQLENIRQKDIAFNFYEIGFCYQSIKKY